MVSQPDYPSAREGTGRDLADRITVLIVEDSPPVRERLVSLVADVPRATIVGAAADGRHARALFAHYRPDAVVLDLQLPDVNGMDLLTEFKRQHPGAVLMVLTTYVFKEIEDRCARLGADHFFGKATEFERVTEVLTAMASDRTSKGRD